MSGGAFDYLYCKEAEQLFGSPSQLQEMADRLAGLPYAADAAKDAYDLLAIVTSQLVRVEAAQRRLADVFYAVEWWDSGDSGEDAVRKALAKYRGES